MRTTLAGSVLLGLLLSLNPTVALPQGETTSAIAGQVTDATDAAIPGATVTIANREMGLQRSAKTDDEGRFNFPQLTPGAYTVKVEAQGFDSRQSNNVFSGLGQKQTVNFTLNFAWSDFYLTKSFPLTERVKLRFETQFFNVFNHPNFGLPSMVLAGIPGKPSTQTGFGALSYTTSPPTGLLGVGLGGDSTPRLIAFQLRLEF
jgi:hypothetical protein